MEIPLAFLLKNRTKYLYQARDFFLTVSAPERSHVEVEPI
jgi:hypothetical protein